MNEQKPYGTEYYVNFNVYTHSRTLEREKKNVEK